MGPVLLIARTRLRRRAVAVVVAGVLLGCGFGLAFFSVAASRQTASAYDRILATADAPDIQNGSFMTIISTANDVPIVVERSLYWDGAGLTWSGGSSAVATRLP